MNFVLRERHVDQTTDQHKRPLSYGVRIAKGSIIGAGAVLLEGTEVPPGSLVVGIPGRVVRQVDEVMTGRVDQSWRHYVAQARRHRAGAFPIQATSTDDGFNK